MRVRAAVLGDDLIDTPLLDFAPLLRRGRFRLSIERLTAAEGRMEAFLVPDVNDRFEIVVDPEPKGGWRRHHEPLREEIQRHRLRFRIAHEIAHSFFYDRKPGMTPLRRPLAVREEERFCDDFAGALLLPPRVVARSAPRPEVVLAVQREYDVSLQLAVRAFAEAHPDHSFVLLYTDEEAPHVRPQWSSSGADWLPRWWTREAIQLFAVREPQTVTIPRKGGRRSRLRATWLPDRRQALLIGRC